MYCSECGNKIENNSSKFCSYCGFPLKIFDIPQEKNTSSSIPENDYRDAKESDIENFLDSNIVQKIETDFFDKFSGIKKGFYDVSELANQRFKFTYGLLYVISIFSFIIGLILLLSQGEKQVSEFFDGKSLALGGFLYLMFTFAFHKLKMSIMMASLSMVMALDKIYVILATHKIGVMPIIVTCLLMLATLQTIRASKYIETTKNKILRYFIVFSFFSFIIVAIIGLTEPEFLESKWTDKISSDIEKDIYDSHYSVLYERAGKETDIILQISKETASCSIKEIKKQFPKYQTLLDNLEKNEDATAKKIDKIKMDCFRLSINNVSKSK